MLPKGILFLKEKAIKIYRNNKSVSSGVENWSELQKNFAFLKTREIQIRFLREVVSFFLSFQVNQSRSGAK